LRSHEALQAAGLGLVSESLILEGGQLDVFDVLAETEALIGAALLSDAPDLPLHCPLSLAGLGHSQPCLCSIHVRRLPPVA
jgi:hypothetical protein